MQLPRVTTARPTQPRRPLSSVGAKALAAATPAPQQPAKPAVKAGASDPLPTFKSSEEYKNYVINLVAQAQSAEQDLKAAQQALDEGKGSQAEVRTHRERLDAIKLQLAVLRDNFPIPKKWTRAKWLGGEGFNKDKFWKEQVEAIPGKEVIVTPKPEPQPETPTPDPSTPQPAPTTGDALPDSLAKLMNQYATDGLACKNDRAGWVAMAAKLEAALKVTEGRKDDQSRRIADVIRDTTYAHSGNSTDDYFAFQAAFIAIQAMASPNGSVDDRTEAAMMAIAEHGKLAQNDRTGWMATTSHMEVIQALGEGRKDPEIAAAWNLVKETIYSHSGNSTDDYYAHQAVFKSVGMLLKPEGTLTDRTKKAMVALSDDGLTGENNRTGWQYMVVQLETIQRMTEGTRQEPMRGINQQIRDTIYAHSGNSTDDYYAFQSTFQAIKAMVE